MQWAGLLNGFILWCIIQEGFRFVPLERGGGGGRGKEGESSSGGRWQRLPAWPSKEEKKERQSLGVYSNNVRKLLLLGPFRRSIIIRVFYLVGTGESQKITLTHDRAGVSVGVSIFLNCPIRFYDYFWLDYPWNEFSWEPAPSGSTSAYWMK